MIIHVIWLQKNAMIPFKKLHLIICFLFLALIKLCGQDLLNYSNSSKYANHLFKNKQYSLSVIEYERVSFMEPADTLAKLRIVQSYRYMHDYKRAKTRLRNFFPVKMADCPKDFALEYVTILFHEHQFDSAYNFINKNQTIELSKRNEYKFGTLLMQYKWHEATSFADNYLIYNQKPQKFDALYNVATQGIDIKYKKPYCAALFSAIIPGSGKVYTKDWKDGIYAFIVVSAFSWLTYNSIKNNGLNFNSVFFGTIAISFYSANIYGSHKSAKKYNRRINERIAGEVQGILFNDY